MSINSQSLVSIGLPVYNGEQYLSAAIESVLSQTYTNIELVISDNGSTDGTRAICENFQSRDRRISYYRNKQNLGAGPNYDKCFQLANGPFFKWAAHDDVIHRQFVEKTREGLLDNPAAVLCFTDAIRIDAQGKVIGDHTLEYPGIDSDNPADRFQSMLLHLRECECFFGLFRRSALAGSELHGNYMNSDLVLMTEMALRGKFIKVSQPLFMHRDHDDRYTRAVYPDRSGASAWFGAGNRPGKSYRAITLYRAYIRIIQNNLLKRAERWSCYRHLWRYVRVKRNRKILFFDLVYLLSPWIYNHVGSIREADINTK